MKAILILLSFVVLTCSAQKGFNYYDNPGGSSMTIEQVFDNLTAQQKVTIVDAYCDRIDSWRFHELHPEIGRHAYDQLGKVFDRVEKISIAAMASDDKPSSQAELLSVVMRFVSDYLTESQINYVIGKMIAYSKYDGSGDWNYYQSQFE